MSIKNHKVCVLKFGGTSVKDVGRIQHVAQLMAGYVERGKVIAVISAMGDTTDYLIRLAKTCAHAPDRRELDQLMATGEQVSCALVAMALQNMGLKAISLTAAQAGIYGEGPHSNARIASINPEILDRCLSEYDVLVITGFQAKQENGDIATLGRGGSDTSAVALAAAIGVDACEIYTDVDGVYTADPNKISDARLIDCLTYEDTAQLAMCGAKIIHPRAVHLAQQSGLRLRIRNTFRPLQQGTVIQGGNEMENYRPVVGVAVDANHGIVAVSGCISAEIPGRVLECLASSGIAGDLINQTFPTNGTIAFTVSDAEMPKAIKALSSICDQFSLQITFESGVDKVSIVGCGISDRPNIAAKAFTTLGQNGIHVRMAATGDRRLTCVINRDDSDRAARLLHEAFALGTPEPAELAKCG